MLPAAGSCRYSESGRRLVARGAGVVDGARQGGVPASAAGVRLDVGQTTGRVVVGNDRGGRLRTVERQVLADDGRVGRHGDVVVVDAHVDRRCLVHPR